MRRFIADACLILMLVAIGSYIAKDDSFQREELHQKISDFEADIAQNKEVKAKVEKASLHDIDENFASGMARKTSEIIVDIVDAGTIIVADLFYGVAN